MLSAPHPLPDSSSPGDRRAWATLAHLCFLKPGQAWAGPRMRGGGGGKFLAVLCKLSQVIALSGPVPQESFNGALKKQIAHATGTKTEP